MAEIWINFAYGDGWGSKLHHDDILVIGPDEKMFFTTPEGYDQTFRQRRERALHKMGWEKCLRLGELLQGLWGYVCFSISGQHSKVNAFWLFVWKYWWVIWGHSEFQSSPFHSWVFSMTLCSITNKCILLTSDLPRERNRDTISAPQLFQGIPFYFDRWIALAWTLYPQHIHPSQTCCFLIWKFPERVYPL